MIYLVFVLVVLTRFVTDPHAPILTPVFGALLFTGARMRKRDAVWFPVTVLAISDWILTTEFFHMQVGWPDAITLLGFAAMAAIGGLLRNKWSAARALACGIGGPTAFFLISNFGVWLGWNLYPRTWSGLEACYIAALPYYRNSILSTLVASSILFACYEFHKKVRRGNMPVTVVPAHSHD
jgi:uncharacterized protein DUF6580